MHIFTEISILLAISAAIAIIMRALRQPLIIGHILTGIIVGPSVLHLVKSPETIEVFSSFGLALLLFIVGLGLNPKVIKEVGKVALLTGTGQVIFTSAIGYAIMRALGYSSTVAIYVAVALTFSSTIIILKLLTDKKEQNKLHGKISIGFLLVQDLIATFALIIASASGKGGLSYNELLNLGLRGIVLALWILVIANFVVKPLTHFLEKSQELLFLFAVAWAFGIGALALQAGFSLEVGALFSGVALATMPYAQEISSRLRPLRDFFIVVFFIALGAKLNLSNVPAIIWQAIGLSIYVLVFNPIIMMMIMGLLGYTKRTSFKAGLTVAQISEFSLIFILLGQKNGQVTGSTVSLVTVIGMITIALSSYMIIYSDSLYKYFEKYLKLFERRKVRYEQEAHHNYEAILFGYRRGGAEFVKALQNITKRYIVIDYDPDVADELERKQVPFLYGDATDLGLLEEVGLEKSRLVISNVTDHETNASLVKLLESINSKAVIICHADNIPEAEELYNLGASYVMLPHFIGNERMGSFIKRNGFKKSEFKRFREKHLEYLHSHYSEEVPVA